MTDESAWSRGLVTLDRVHGSIALLTLNNPPLNLTRIATIDRVLELLEVVRKDTSFRALVIVGSGSRAFCAGSDINEFVSIREHVVEAKSRRENEAFTSIEELPIPTIAAINGHALGGGAEMAIACDLRIMDQTAKIGFPEVKLGVFAGSGGLFRLPRLIGHGRALELLYTGELIDATRALDIGLVGSVAEEGTALEHAVKLAQHLSMGPAAALTAIAAGVRASHSQTTAEAVEFSLRQTASVFLHTDVDEGVRAFRERRPAVFSSKREEKE